MSGIYGHNSEPIFLDVTRFFFWNEINVNYTFNLGFMETIRNSFFWTRFFFWNEINLIYASNWGREKRVLKTAPKTSQFLVSFDWSPIERRLASKFRSVNNFEDDCETVMNPYRDAH